ENTLVDLNADSGYLSESERVVGNFANLAVVRSNISGSVSFHQLLSLIGSGVSETMLPEGA
ncbi:MAG: hypothetical protein ACREPR_20630, partial [Brasilonema sp.]